MGEAKFCKDCEHFNEYESYTFGTVCECSSPDNWIRRKSFKEIVSIRQSPKKLNEFNSCKLFSYKSTAR